MQKWEHLYIHAVGAMFSSEMTVSHVNGKRVPEYGAKPFPLLEEYLATPVSYTHLTLPTKRIV